MVSAIIGGYRPNTKGNIRGGGGWGSKTEIEAVPFPY